MTTQSPFAVENILQCHRALIDKKLEMNSGHCQIYMLSYNSFCERMVGNCGNRLHSLDLSEKYFIYHPALAPCFQERTSTQPFLAGDKIAKHHSSTANKHFGFFGCNTTTAAVAASAVALAAIAVTLSSRFM